MSWVWKYFLYFSLVNFFEIISLLWSLQWRAFITAVQPHFLGQSLQYDSLCRSLKQRTQAKSRKPQAQQPPQADRCPPAFIKNKEKINQTPKTLNWKPAIVSRVVVIHFWAFMFRHGTQTTGRRRLDTWTGSACGLVQRLGLADYSFIDRFGRDRALFRGL